MVTAVAWVQSLARELLHATGAARKKKKSKKETKIIRVCTEFAFFKGNLVSGQ